MTTAYFTGLDVLASNGTGNDEFWQSLVDGVSGLGRTSLFDSTQYGTPVSGEVATFTPDGLPRRMLPSTDRMTQMSLLVADRALADSGADLANFTDTEVGVLTAASAGGYAFGQRELQNLWSQGPKYVSAYQSYAWFYAVNTGQISIRHELRGHSGVVVADSAGGLDAIAASARRLRHGSRLMITGAVDSTMCPWGWVAHTSTGNVSTAADPAEAYLPFDSRACGYVPGEGGAHLVLETEPRKPYGVLAGHGASLAPERGDGSQALVDAITTALTQADMGPRDIDLVVADGAGDRRADAAEAWALQQVFGGTSVPVTVPKTGTGRMGSANGAIDVATALLALKHQIIPPTLNVQPDPNLHLNLVTTPCRAQLRAALVLGRGYGGFTSALIVSH